MPTRKRLASGRRFGWTRKLRKGLFAALIAWVAPSLSLTVPNMVFKLEVDMRTHVAIEVQGDAGVRVGPGLVKR
jgi:hypothetical protein